MESNLENKKIRASDFIREPLLPMNFYLYNPLKLLNLWLKESADKRNLERGGD